MPIPKPHAGEDQQTFVSRCMGDKVMQEYEQEQRAGICYTQWRRRNKAQEGEELAEIKKALASPMSYEQLLERGLR